MEEDALTPAKVLAKVRQLAQFLEAPEASPETGAAGATSSNVSQKDFETFRDMIGKTSEQLENQSNKVALGWASMRNEQERHGILQALLQQAELLFTCTFLMISSAGLCCAAARGEIVAAVTQVAAALAGFMETLERQAALGKDAFTAEAAHKCGAVWEACKGVRLVAKTNRAASKRRILRAARAVKDTHDEFDQMLQSARQDDVQSGHGQAEPDASPAATETSQSGGGASEIGSDAWYAMMDDLGDESDLDDEDQDRLERGLALIRAAGMVIQSAAKAIGVTAPRTPEREASPAGRAQYIAWLDAVVAAATKAEKAVTAFAVNLYPPHDQERMVASNADMQDRTRDLTEAIARESAILEDSAEPHVKALQDLQSSLASLTL